MSISMSQITIGKIDLPYLLGVGGGPGVGKSSLGASMPDPIFITAENGTNFLNVARFPTPKKWPDVIECLDLLAKEKHKYKTLVIDSMDWIEMLVHSYVCETNKPTRVYSIELAENGYGKGYIKAFNYFIEMKNKLELLRLENKMNILLIFHNEMKEIYDPINLVSHVRNQIKMHKKTSAMFIEFLDALFFATFKTFAKEEQGKKTKMYGGEDRVIYTSSRPSFEAKNRYGLPFELPLSWKAISDAIDSATKTKPEEIHARVMAQAETIKDEELRKKIFENINVNKSNAGYLLKCEERISEILNT
jgi:hypothetical protein